MLQHITHVVVKTFRDKDLWKRFGHYEPLFPIIRARAIVFIFILIWVIMNPREFPVGCSFKGIKGVEIVLVAFIKGKTMGKAHDRDCLRIFLM